MGKCQHYERKLFVPFWKMLSYLVLNIIINVPARLRTTFMMRRKARLIYSSLMERMAMEQCGAYVNNFTTLTHNDGARD